MTPVQKKTLWWTGGVAVGAGTLLAVFLWPKKVSAATTAPKPAASLDKIAALPGDDGNSLWIALGGTLWVDFLQPLPAGYKWTAQFSGNYNAIIQQANTGANVENLPVFMVKPQGKGHDRIDFTAYQYDANGYPTKAPTIGPVGFWLDVG